MTEEIIEGDVLIDIFYNGRMLVLGTSTMARQRGSGGRYLNYYDCCNVTDLKYHSSWDWLMDVVEKIESLGYTFKICRRRAEIYIDGEHNPYPKFMCKQETKIKSAWLAAIIFIKWHNQNTIK